MMRRCCICGKPIRSPFIIWDRNAEAYCYDCHEKLKEMKRQMRQARQEDNLEERARKMYRRNVKPSEISRRLHITREEVYELLKGEEEYE